jgi:hypothetical protein
VRGEERAAQAVERAGAGPEERADGRSEAHAGGPLERGHGLAGAVTGGGHRLAHLAADRLRDLAGGARHALCGGHGRGLNRGSVGRDRLHAPRGGRRDALHRGRCLRLHDDLGSGRRRDRHGRRDHRRREARGGRCVGHGGGGGAHGLRGRGSHVGQSLSAGGSGEKHAGEGDRRCESTHAYGWGLPCQDDGHTSKVP